MKVDTSTFEFDWNAGNAGKNKKHGVEDWECEEVFFDQRKVLLKDAIHSANEDRFILLGTTKHDRLLYLVFTVRRRKVRIISARDINKKERYLYEKAA